MWQAKEPKKDSGSTFGKDAVFATVSLRQDQKEEFVTWADAMYPDVHILLADFCRQGYRVTMKFDGNNACYQSSITQQDENHIHSGVIVTSRSDDPMETLMLGLYKCLIMFPDVEMPTKRERDHWG
jgi:hypothetical protein